MRLRSSTLFSVALHAAVVWALQAMEKRSRAATQAAPIEVAILEKPEAKPPTPPPPEAPKEAPRVKPVLVKKLTRPPPPPSQEPVREPPPPPPPPAGFSLDSKEVAPASQSGVAVPAVEGGGNLFADPQRKDLPAGPKTATPPPVPPPPQKAVPIYEVTRRPELLSETEMTGFYTEEAKELGIEGSVLIELEVRADGTVANPRVVRGLGHGLDQNAVRAARSLRFRPAYRCAEAVPVWITVPFAFRLED